MYNKNANDMKTFSTIMFAWCLYLVIRGCPDWHKKVWKILWVVYWTLVIASIIVSIWWIDPTTTLFYVLFVGVGGSCLWGPFIGVIIYMIVEVFIK